MKWVPVGFSAGVPHGAPGADLADDGPAGREYVVAPVIGVRIAGSPVEDLRQLCFAESWALAQQHSALSEWLRAEGRALSDLLHPVIGGCVGGGVKPVLVALRRAVFQVKVPGDRLWCEGVGEVLPADLTTRIAAWVSELDRLGVLEARLPEVLAAEKVAKTSALRQAVGGRAFRFALLLGSPSLAEALDEWIEQPSAPPPRGPVLGRVAKYLARAVAKTSPYASFTVSGLGRWVASGPAVCPAEDLSWRGVAELERWAVLRIWSALCERAECREHIRVRINPTAIETGGWLRFPRRGGG